MLQFREALVWSTCFQSEYLTVENWFSFEGRKHHSSSTTSAYSDQSHSHSLP
jgi:hypothetical protein